MYMTQMFTAGYEGKTANSFILKLLEKKKYPNGIKQIKDTVSFNCD